MERTEDIKEKLKEISKNNEIEPIKFLDDIRRLVVDINLRQLSLSVDKKTVGIIYLIRKMTNDIWINIFTDASFRMLSKLQKIKKC